MLTGAVNGTDAVKTETLAVPIVGAPGTDVAVTPAKLSIIPLMLSFL